MDSPHERRKRGESKRPPPSSRFEPQQDSARKIKSSSAVSCASRHALGSGQRSDPYSPLGSSLRPFHSATLANFRISTNRELLSLDAIARQSHRGGARVESNNAPRHGDGSHSSRKPTPRPAQAGGARSATPTFHRQFFSLGSLSLSDRPSSLRDLSLEAASPLRRWTGLPTRCGWHGVNCSGLLVSRAGTSS